MAAIDKLLRSLEALKIHTTSSSSEEAASNARSKEKIALGMFVTDMICSPDARCASNYQLLFSVALETLLKMTDDPDSDIRMIADECLNRIIRSQIVVNVGKVTAELHKEVKRNGPARSLRAALWRFAELAHLIKPAQGRAYVKNLVPCLDLIAARKEESVQETLADAIPKIMEALGCFLSDNEAKGLLQEFLNNLNSDNAVVRRAAASSIVGISANCPNSSVFLIHTLTTLLDLVIPVHENQSVQLILGVLNCIRGIIPYLDKTNGKESYLRGSFGVKRNAKTTILSADTVLQVYELCLHWTYHEDHNVITAALETLLELLSNPPEQLVTILLDPQGLIKSKIHVGISKKLTTKTLSQLSVDTGSCIVGDESQLVEEDLISTEKVTEWLSAAGCEGPESLSPSRRSCGGRSISPNRPTLSSVSDYLDSESLASEDLSLIIKPEAYESPEHDVFSRHDSPSPPESTKSCHRVMRWDIGTVTSTGCPLLFFCARRLVSGFLVPEGPKIRVSVRCLALNNLCQVVRLCPEAFTLTIDKNGLMPPQGPSHVFDVLQYSTHSDPQLRGLVALLIGQFIRAKCNRSAAHSDEWLAKTPGKALNLQILMGILLQSLKDQSSVCVKHALTGAGLCIYSILESNECILCIPILNEILNLVYNPYWLVKVKVIEFFGVLPFMIVHYVTGSEDFQNKFIESLVVFLSDEDSRVRKVTAAVISKLVKQMYFPVNHGVDSTVEAKGVELSSSLFQSVLSLRKKEIVCQIEEGALSRLINLLIQTLMLTPEKYATYGCIEALCKLSENFHPVHYPLGWQCLGSSPLGDMTLSENCLLSLVVSLLTKSSVSLDLECHHWLLTLAGNLFFGKLTHLSKRGSAERCPALYEDLLVHVMRILCIFSKVMEEKTVVTSSGSLPLRKKTIRSLSPPNKGTSSSEKGTKDENKRMFGAISGNPHCLKLNDVIKAGFSNYRLTLDRTSSEKFLNLISSTLKCVEQLLTHCNAIVNASLIAEELLQYLSVTFVLDSASTVRVASQLLRTLMEVNVEGHLNHQVESRASVSTGFYAKVFQSPHEDIMRYISPPSNATSSPKEQPLKSSRSTDISTLAMRIKLFESIVIQSLKVYTITSNVDLQVEVLALLTQLVQLKVNYYLLDAQQIFVKFVKQQFDYLEKGQIRNPEVLIPRIFTFLVHLSNDKNHSKPVISVPEIILLCDGLLASGRNPVTHCIPALMPVVEHVFLFNASNAETKELETEQEVIFNMLIRLAEFPQVLDILLYLMREGWRWEDHWKRWYRKTVDTVLPLLAEGKLLVNDISSLLALLHLNENFCAPLNNVLVLLFSHQQESQSISQWMGMLAAMLISVCLYKEKRVLLQLEEMNLYVREEGDDPLKVNAVSKSLPSSVLLSKLVLRVVSTSVDKLTELIETGRHAESTTNELEKNLATFLLCWVTVFRLDKYQEVSRSLEKLLRLENEFKSVNEKIASIGFKCPRLALIWVEMIMLINIGDDVFWKPYIAASMTSPQPTISLNLELVRRGSALIFCEYLAKQHDDIESLRWFLKERARDVIWNCYEPPVERLLSVIVDLEANSKILLESISPFINVVEPIFVRRMFHTIENIHNKFTGSVLCLVASSLLKHRNIGIARLAAAFCCRTVEYLLFEEKSVVHSLLKYDQLLDVYNSLKACRKSYIRHNALVSLLKKLSENVYGTPLEETATGLKDDVKSAMNLKLDKLWFMEQIKPNCSSSDMPNGMQCARLLSAVDSEDELIDIMSRDNFDKVILQHCISLGTLLTVQLKIQNSDANLDCLVPLYESARRCLLEAVFQNCDSYRPGSIDREEVMGHLKIKDTLCPLVLAAVSFFDSLQDLGLNNELSRVLPTEFHLPLCRFALMCLEVVIGILDRKSEWEGWPSLIYNFLSCSAAVLSYDVLASHLRLSDVQIVKRAVQSIHKAITGEDVAFKEFDFDREKLEIIKESETLRNRVEIGNLLNWTADPAEKNEIPEHILRPIKGIIISLGRAQNINWLWSVPPEIWQIDAGSHSLLPVPFHFLQESEIVERVVNRIRLLGWTGRQQFEEAWVCLLGTLSPGDELDELDQAEVASLTQAKSLAIEGITWLVISTLTVDAGRSSTKLLHVPRLDCSKIRSHRYWKRLEEIGEAIKWKMKTADRHKALNFSHVHDRPNLDRLNSFTSYGFGQLSVEYLRKGITDRESITDDFDDGKMAARNVDVRSCIQFVLDLYQQWAHPESGTPLNLQFSMIKSIVCLSDLFIEENHFQWMLDTFLAMVKSHSPQDENVHQYLILGTAKAAAVLEAFEGETGEKVFTILEFGLKSNLNLLKSASVQGILYLLQSAAKIEKPNSTSELPKQSAQEFRQKLVDLTLEYILGNLGVHDQFYSSEIVLTMDLACYFAEVYNAELTPSSRQHVINFITQIAATPCNHVVYQCAIHGLERLVLVGAEEFKEAAVRLALDRLAQSDPLISLLALKLLVACIYTDKNEADETDEPTRTMEIMERTSALFDKIKKGYPIEVEIICHILPRILSDFFPVSDVSTKVISEFLSPNQPHKREVADIVFQVFSQAIKEGQLPLLQDWIVHSVKNFTHNLPAATSYWSLCCFFICASDNPWLRALFPRVQSRIRQSDLQDRTFLCVAALQFYKELNEEQKTTFLKSFKETAASQKSVFHDIISCIE